MEQSALSDLKAQITSRENTKSSRRFSASSLKSFRDDERCLRSTTTISSTASSPGYMHATREEIDPSTYSFTAALKALQAKAVYSWEYLPSHRLTLHSKWSDAEKYISNPLSGEVPLECLSAKTLSARSFSNRITISAPLVYQTNYPIIQHQHKLNITIQEKKRCTTKDAETQSTAANVSPSPVPTPPIQERPTKRSEGEFGDSSVSSEKEKSEAEQVEEREEKEKEGRKVKEGRERGRERKTKMMMMMCREGGGRRGCLSLKGLWKRDKCKPRKNNMNPSSSPIFLYHINACFDE